MSDSSRLKIHPTAVVDEGAIIGESTAIWHFSHICAGAVIGGELLARPKCPSC
jgi:UDP-2-acetamido-3-amino-2,3-dideoxy-glucuronate N-acetyltransferase